MSDMAERTVPRWQLQELMDRISYQAKDHLHNQPLREKDNTDSEKDSLREEAKALRKRVAELELVIDQLRRELLEEGR